MDNELLFTPAALLDFLLQVDELADYEVSVEESPNGLQVKIGDSSYVMKFLDAQEVEVPADVVAEVSDINESAYEEVANSDYTQTEDDDNVVEGGILSEALKTLAVGGMVRLTSKLLGKDVAETLLKGK